MLRREVPLWWATEMLFAIVFIAWEQIEAGRFAPLDAPGLVLDTWLAAAPRQLGNRLVGIQYQGSVGANP